MRFFSYRLQTRMVRLTTYLALLLGSAVFALPFLWMVSSSFKDLETIFEYPPSFVPREIVREEWNGKLRSRAAWQAQGGARERGYILDQRPGEYQVQAIAGGIGAAPKWVPERSVQLEKRVRVRLENYPEAWSAKPFTRYLLNTLFVTALCILGQVLTSSLVAFGFARLEFPGQNLFFLVVLATMMLPQEVTMIPTYLIFRSLGWIDTFLPLIVPSFLGGGAFSIFLFRQFFLTLPRELDEAARMDGCSSLGIYWNILMPLCKPIIATLAVFAFVGHWNDFLTPLIYLNSSDKFTLAIGLRFFQGVYLTDMHLLMAASTLVLLPVLVVFFLGQRYFVKSIVLSGIKG
jgi:ABC-type glycerol-3-phosphate transport system permease component